MKKKYSIGQPLSRLYTILDIAKEDITAIYIYAALAGALSLTVPVGIQSIINFAVSGLVSSSLIVLIILVIVGVLLTGLLQINQMKLIEKIQQKIFVRFSYEFTYKIPHFDTLKVDAIYLPELVNRFFDTSTLQKSIRKLLLDIPTAMIEIVFALLLLSLYSSVFVFFSILIVIILYLILYFTGSLGLKTSMEESDHKYSMAAWLEEIARVYKSLKFRQSSAYTMEVSDGIAVNYIQSRTKHFKILLYQYWSLIGFKMFITGGMLATGAFLLINNEINVGQFVAAEIAIIIVMNAIEKIIKSLESVYDLLTSLEKLAKVTELETEVSGNLEMDATHDAFTIELKDLDFGYNEGSIISKINCVINSGDKVAICGTNGSGKTTLLKLLSLSYPIEKGKLLINSLPLSNYNTQSLRAKIGVMFSEQDIFKGSLLSNITLGNSNISINEIMRIAEVIGLSKHISELKKGLNTNLEPMGKGMPSSFVKKVLLCRALVGNPSLVILDEPFNIFYDPKEKKEIIDFLISNFKDSSIIIATNEEYYLSKCHTIINI